MMARAHGEPFLEDFPAADGHPGDLRGETLDVFGLFLQEGFGNEQGKIGVAVARLLEHAVQLVADQFPYLVAIGADDHHALHRRIVGQLGLLDHVHVPGGEIHGFLGDVLYKIVFSGHFFSL